MKAIKTSALILFFLPLVALAYGRGGSFVCVSQLEQRTALPSGEFAILQMPVKISGGYNAHGTSRGGVLVEVGERKAVFRSPRGTVRNGYIRLAGDLNTREGFSLTYAGAASVQNEVVYRVPPRITNFEASNEVLSSENPEHEYSVICEFSEF